jgi:nucleoside permease NupC
MLNYLILAKVLMPEQQQQEEHIDDLFMKAIEEKAAELEVTVDYYMAEFM